MMDSFKVQGIIFSQISPICASYPELNIIILLFLTYVST